MTNSTFVGNSAGTGSAGAIYNTFNASLTINNSTFSANGGGTTLNNAGGAAAVVLRNSIITGSTAGAGTACAGGPYTADSSNFDTDGTCGDATTSSGLNLQPLADNGGPTQTVALGAGSAAFDAGDPTVCAAVPVSGRDQRGEIRPQGVGCDSGAYESNGAVGEISGIVRDDLGIPLQGATVSLLPSGMSVLTDAAGSFAFTGLPAAESFRVFVVPPVGSGLAIEYYLDSYEEATAELVSASAGVPLTIDLNQAGTVTGTVTDESGTPQTGVDIFANVFTSLDGWVSDTPYGTTDAAARTRSSCRREPRAICARTGAGDSLLEGCSPVRGVLGDDPADGLVVSEGATISGFDLVLAPDRRATVDVTVLDEAGDPTVGNVVSLNACLEPAVPVATADLCSDGQPAVSFRIVPNGPIAAFTERLAAGTYNVAGGVSPDSGITILNSSTTQITVGPEDVVDCTFTVNAGATGAAACTVT